MKAPEKFYTDENGLFPMSKRHCDSDIEYTRTDAFVEKACMNLKKLMYDNLMFKDRLHRETIINNFIKDFKKYMEEN